MRIAFCSRVTTTPGPAAPIITMRSVTRRFNGVTAVDDLTLDAGQGSILGMVGPSGSGKTTTVRMLTGTLAPTSGEIRVLGEVPMRFHRHTRERIAYMPQLFSLYPDLSVQENVGFVAALYGVPPWKRGKLEKRVLGVVDLWDVRHRLARELSGGMQRRLELACALVNEPAVLFVDEPTAGIDPMLRQSIWDELRRLRNEGRTLLVTTQYVAEAEYCDRVAMLADGGLVALDEPDALRRSVFGGEVLEVVADGTVSPELLTDVPDVLSVKQTDPERLVVVVEDAGIATPRIMTAITRAGRQVLKLEEYQPSFDDVFAGLVERHRSRGQAAPADEAARRV